MKTYQSPSTRPSTDTVIAIGSFDGVHLGHRHLLEILRERAKHFGVPSVVYTFDPPTRVLTQGTPYLCTLPEKLALLEQYHIDEVIVTPFTPEFAARPKEAFLDDLRTLRPKAIVVGEDFGFGKGRSGTTHDLAAITPELITLSMQLLDSEPIKSTRIRESLHLADIDSAARLLGRDYEAVGVVVHGDQLGRTIGFPTANIAVPQGKLLPKGVYAVWISTEYGVFPAMANVGTRPTIAGAELRFEVHIFNFNADLYGQEVQVQFKHFLRTEQKFSGLDQLTAQLAQDKHNAQTWLSHNH